MTPSPSRHLWYATLVSRDIFYSPIVKVVLFYTQTHGGQTRPFTPTVLWGSGAVGESVLGSSSIDRRKNDDK